MSSDDSGVRPWMSLCWLALVAAAILAGDSPSQEPGAGAPGPARVEAASFWRAHSYLSAPEPVIELAVAEVPNAQRRLARAALLELGERQAPPDGTRRTTEQAVLDQLVRVRPLVSSGNTPVPGSPLVVALSILQLGLLALLATAVEKRLGHAAMALLALGTLLVSFAAMLAFEGGAHSGLPLVQGSLASLAAAAVLVRAPGQSRLFDEPTRIGLALPILPWAAAALAMASIPALAGAGPAGITAPFAGLAFGGAAGAAMRPRRGRVPAKESLHQPRTPSSADEAATIAVEDARNAEPTASQAAAVEPAFERLERELLGSPARRDLASALLEEANRQDRVADAAPALMRHVRTLIQARDTEPAADLWCDLQARLDPLPGEDPGLLLAIIPALVRSQRSKLAGLALHRCLAARSQPLPLSMALRILEHSQQLDPSLTPEAAQRVLAYPDLHADKGARIRALLGMPPEASSTPPEEIGASDFGKAPLDLMDGFVPPPPKPRVKPKLVRSPEDLVVPDDWDPDPELLGSSAAAGLDLSPEHVTQNPDATIQAFGGVAPPPIPSRPLPAPTATPDSRALDALPRFDRMTRVDAVPRSLDEHGIELRLANRRSARIAYGEIQALSVAAIRDLSQKPVVVIDLLMNWSERGESSLRGIRLRSDRFDPSAIVPDSESPLAALRALLELLHERSGAQPLPDEDSARGRPFRAYAQLRDYERQILKLDR